MAKLWDWNPAAGFSLNPLSWTGIGAVGEFGGPIGGELSEDEKRRQALLEEAAGAAGGFANRGERGFGRLGNDANAVRDMLQQHATGQQSFSREALRQGLGQQLSQQRSMAAGVNSPMGALTAANNMARASYGMSGQAALADIAERQAFAKALADTTLQQRQQELQAALGSRGNQMTGLGAGNPFVKDPSLTDKLISGGSQAFATFAGKK